LAVGERWDLPSAYHVGGRLREEAKTVDWFYANANRIGRRLRKQRANAVTGGRSADDD
jgi:hypothetical protein